MPATVALLRAVNLGRRNKVPMAELRALCGDLGYADATTFIASGNVVFPTKAPAARTLEAAIAEAFGVETTVMYRTAEQLATLVATKPFGKQTAEAYVAFLEREPARANFEALSTSDFPGEAWERIGADLVLLYRTGFHRAKLTTARLERLLDVEVTMRNWRTATKLAELAAR